MTAFATDLASRLSDHEAVTLGQDVMFCVSPATACEIPQQHITMHDALTAYEARPENIALRVKMLDAAVALAAALDLRLDAMTDRAAIKRKINA